MFEEANRENFEVWTEKLINGGLQNLKIIKDFEWREKHSASNFDLLKSLQQSLDLAEEILISGLCYVKRIANHFLKLNSLSIYKLAVSCILIAQKFYSDFHYEIEDFSISSGVTIKDILNLQTITLELLNYDLILTERDYYGVLFSEICESSCQIQRLTE